VDRSRSVLAAAVAYLFDAFLIVPYALTFPGVVDRYGFVGNEQSAVSLWVLWHLTFPIIIASGLVLPRRVSSQRGRTRAIGAALVVAALAVAAVTLGRDALPVLVHNGTFSPVFSVVASALSLANVAAIVMVLARQKPLRTLSLWLVVAMTASALDTGLSAIAPTRYSAAWYVGKCETFVTASVVLVSLLAAWGALYAQSASLSRRLYALLVERGVLVQSLQRERRISLALQEASLPRTLPQFERVVLSAAYHPGNDEATIGGDWYDAFALRDGRIAITLGDVLGNGLRAAVTMSKLRQAMQSAAMLDPSPLAMLRVADETIRLHDPDRFASAVALVYDPLMQIATYACAGHPAPIMLTVDGTLAQDVGDGMLLGLAADADFRLRHIAVPDGATLVLYTDGIVEWTRDLARGEALLRAAIATRANDEGGDVAETIVRSVLSGRHAIDDVAVLTMHVRPTTVPAARTLEARAR